MIGNTFHQLFLIGANRLATTPLAYGEEQQTAGFTQEEWLLLTSESCWSKSEQLKIPSVLSAAVSITLRTGGLPATTLPGAFVAATICKLVAPCNRLLAAASSPASFDAMSASGITAEPQVILTTPEQMYALVIYFSSAEFGALESFPIDDIIEASVAAAEAEA